MKDRGKPLEDMTKQELIDEVIRLEVEAANQEIRPSAESLLVLSRVWGILFQFYGKYHKQIQKRQRQKKLHNDIRVIMREGALFTYLNRGIYREALSHLGENAQETYELMAQAMRFDAFEKMEAVRDGVREGMGLEPLSDMGDSEDEDDS